MFPILFQLFLGIFFQIESLESVSSFPLLLAFGCLFLLMCSFLSFFLYLKKILEILSDSNIFSLLSGNGFGLGRIPTFGGAKIRGAGGETSALSRKRKGGRIRGGQGVTKV